MKERITQPPAGYGACLQGITSSGIRETQQNQDYDLCGVIITFLQGHHVSLENIHQSVLLLKQVLNPA